MGALNKLIFYFSPNKTHVTEFKCFYIFNILSSQLLNLWDFHTFVYQDIQNNIYENTEYYFLCILE